MIQHQFISRQKLHHYLVISNTSLEERLYQVVIDDTLYQVVYLTPKEEREIEIPEGVQDKVTIKDITR